MGYFSNEEYKDTIIAQSVVIGELRNEVSQAKKDAEMYQRWYKQNEEKIEKLEAQIKELTAEK